MGNPNKTLRFVIICFKETKLETNNGNCLNLAIILNSIKGQYNFQIQGIYLYDLRSFYLKRYTKFKDCLELGND